MRASTVARLALAGTRTDTLRVALTAISAFLATFILLVTAAVMAIPDDFSTGDAAAPGWAPQYQLQVLVEPGLRTGVVIALLLLTIPVLALTAQTGRLGAPARDRRLAAIRLAGGTPGQAVAVAASETGVASAVGSLVALITYLAARLVINGQTAVDGVFEAGSLLLPTDVLPPVWALVAVSLGVPLLGTGLAIVLLRRVTMSPYGVVRRTRDGSPRAIIGLLLVASVGVIAVVQPLYRWAADHDRTISDWVFPTVLVLSALLACFGVVAGTGWISHTTGRILLRVGKGPASVLAARRLLADPWSGSRAFSVLIVCVLFGAGASGVRSWFATDFAVQDDQTRWQNEHGLSYGLADYSFYFDAFDLVNGAVWVAIALTCAAMLVSIAEDLVSQRRTYASLTAVGTPRRVLAKAILIQRITPIVPAVLIALAMGVYLPRFIRSEVTEKGQDQGIPCDMIEGSINCDANNPYVVALHIPAFTRKIPIPFDDLAALGLGAVLAVLVVTAIGLLFLRAATDLEEIRVG